MTKKFNYLRVPETWRQYWTRYPEGYTILEALIDWVSQVNLMVENQNDWIEYLEDFVKTFDKNVQGTVSKLLNEWYEDGTLADIINNEVFDMKADKADLERAELEIARVNSHAKNIAIDITQPPYNGKPGEDIRDALEMAVTDLSTRGGGTIKIPSGVYYIDGSVDLPSNIHILGERGTILTKSANATEGYMFTGGRTRGTTGYGGGAKNITIEKIEFRGYINDVTATYHPVALTWNHVQNLVIRDCRFLNTMTRDHAIDLGGCNDVLIENCSFEGSFNLPGREYNECIQIDSSTPGAIPGFINYDGLPTKDVTIRGCQFLPVYNPNGTIYNYAPHPVGNHGYTGGKPYKNIVFENNLVVDGQVYSTPAGWRAWLHFYGTHGLKIINNRFINTQGTRASVIGLYTSPDGRYDPITLEPGSGTPVTIENVLISGNTFQGFNESENLTDLIRIYGVNYDNITYRAKSISIVDNEFIDCSDNSFTEEKGGCAIHVYRFKDVVIRGNKVDKATHLARVWGGSRVTITDNVGNDLNTMFLYLNDVENAVVANNTANYLRRPLDVGEVTNLTIANNVFTDVQKRREEEYANRLRNLVNANIIGNVTVSNNTMDFAYYVYDTANIANNINNFDNIGVGFNVRPYNISGNLQNYEARP